jgi:hypothetical protein
MLGIPSPIAALAKPAVLRKFRLLVMWEYLDGVKFEQEDCSSFTEFAVVIISGVNCLEWCLLFDKLPKLMLIANRLMIMMSIEKFSITPFQDDFCTLLSFIVKVKS